MLAVQSLNQFYGGSHTLWDVDLDVRPGSRVCLQERAGRPQGSPALLVAQDRGGVLGADTVPVVVHVDLCGHENKHC